MLHSKAKMSLARRGFVAGLGAWFCVAAARAAGLGTSDMVVADPLSGIAIFGFDPVAYFIEGRARAGDPDHEAVWSGVAWRFCSEANRIAFLRNPEVFAPAFGGYDAEAVSRGTPVDSDPTVYLIEDGRLLLFRSVDARQRWLATDLRATADAAWPGMRRLLNQ